MIQHPITAEEKLLRLIRQKGPVQPGNKKKIIFTFLPPEVLLSLRSLDWIGILNQCVVVCCVVVAGYIGYLFFQPPVDPLLAGNKKAAVVIETNLQGSKIFPDVKSVSYYETVLSQKDVFLAPWEKPDVSNGTQPPADTVSNLKVVGIILDQDPKAIVENTQTSETLFLSAGEEVGGAKVESIFSDKVVFQYQGRQFELSP
jgi:type II secretory pathway component PulC